MPDSVRDLETKSTMMQKYHGEILRMIDAAEILCPAGLHPDCDSKDICQFKYESCQVGYYKCNLFYLRTVMGDGE
jgi:hypothetical protein